MDTHLYSGRIVGPGALCRMDERFLASLAGRDGMRAAIAGACLTTLAGSAVYGFAFGLWRAPLQGFYSAVKLPGVLFGVVLASALVNTILAQLMGARLSFKQVCLAMLFCMAVAAALLGAVSPVVLFLALNIPGPDPAALNLPADHPVVIHSMRVFWPLLLSHVAIIGVCGVAGYVRLYRLLTRLIGAPRLALRVLLVWLAVSGFVGCEISWLFSPFLCKPNFEPHFITRTYHEGNFYEQMRRGIQSLGEERPWE